MSENKVDTIKELELMHNLDIIYNNSNHYVKTHIEETIANNIDEHYLDLIYSDINEGIVIKYISHSITNKTKQYLDISIQFFINTNYSIEWDLIEHMITEKEYNPDRQFGIIFPTENNNVITITITKLCLYQNNTIYFRNKKLNYQYIFIPDLYSISIHNTLNLYNDEEDTIKLNIVLKIDRPVQLSINGNELQLTHKYSKQLSLLVPINSKIKINDNSDRSLEIMKVEYYIDNVKHIVNCLNNKEYILNSNHQKNNNLDNNSKLTADEYYNTIINKYNTIPFTNKIESILYQNTKEQYNYIITSTEPKIIDISNEVFFLDYLNMMDYIINHCYIFNIYNPHTINKQDGYKYKNLLQQKVQNIYSSPTSELIDKFNIVFPYNLENIQRHFWLNKKNNITKVHHDNNRHNFNISLQGGKEWILFKPTKLFKPNEKYSIHYEWLKDDIDDILDKIPSYINVTIKPGEMLFIPEYWYHYTETLEENSINIHFWKSTNQ